MVTTSLLLQLGGVTAALAVVLVIVRLTARRRHRSASIDVTPVSTQWLTEHRVEGRDRFSS